MTMNKNFKRLVRTRMQETGEAYTTARMHILAEQEKLKTVIQSKPEKKQVDGTPE